MIDKLINDVNSVIFCLDALIRPPFPLFSAIANEVRQSVELFTIAMSEKELHSGRGALRKKGKFVKESNINIPNQ